MAKDNKNGRSFDLDKGQKRSFDLEKKTTKRFDLSKEDEDVVPMEQAAKASSKATDNLSDKAIGQSVMKATTDGAVCNSEKKKSLKPALIGAAVALLAIGAFFVFNANNGESASSDNAQPISELTQQPSADESQQPEEFSTPSPSEPNAEQSQTSASQPVSRAETNRPTQESSNPAIVPVTSVSSTPQGQTANAQLASTIEQQAKQVIRGEFGNGEERRQKLGAAYDEIQRIVNEMYRSENLQQ